MVILAAAAAIIASQAIISGAFSLTMQAIQLGYMPRLRVNYTSERVIGQIYVPVVNWALMLSSIGLVLGFGTSSNLAAAYGVAITTTMLITTILFYVVARRRWHWPAAGRRARGRLLHQHRPRVFWREYDQGRAGRMVSTARLGVDSFPHAYLAKGPSRFTPTPR